MSFPSPQAKVISTTNLEVNGARLTRLVPLAKQKEQVLAHLKEHGSITSMDAIKLYWITRLSQYIYLLRNDGCPIEDVIECKDGKHWKRYLWVVR